MVNINDIEDEDNSYNELLKIVEYFKSKGETVKIISKDEYDEYMTSAFRDYSSMTCIILKGKWYGTMCPDYLAPDCLWNRHIASVYIEREINDFTLAFNDFEDPETSIGLDRGKDTILGVAEDLLEYYSEEKCKLRKEEREAEEKKIIMDAFCPNI